MIRHVRLVCSLVASLLLASAASAQTADPAMDKLIKDYEQVWMKADAKALAALYSEDAINVNEAGVVTRGRAAIEKSATDTFLGPLKGSRLAVTSGASQAVAPDVTINEGTYTITGGSGPDGKPITLKGHYVNTRVKKGEAWVIAGNTTFVPATPPAAAKAPGKTQ
jgi:uncharacterized protein (TIGR02246 family)